MKTQPAKDRLPARREPARLERVVVPPPQHQKRTLVVHHFAWHRIIMALALLTLAVGAVI